MLYNDLSLRKQYKLPATKIETDSYVAVQLIEDSGELNFSGLRYMAEKLEGLFTIAVLTDKDDLYFIKGDNPMCLYHYPERGLYVYTSTEEILRTALRQLPFPLGIPVRVDMTCGNILRIDKDGNQEHSAFDTGNLFPYMYKPWMDLGFQSASVSGTTKSIEDDYLEDLKTVAMYYGIYPTEIDKLLADGFTTDEIEELLYCG